MLCINLSNHIDPAGAGLCKPMAKEKETERGREHCVNRHTNISKKDMKGMWKQENAALPNSVSI